MAKKVLYQIVVIAAFLYSCKKDASVKPAPAQTDGKTGMLLAVNTLRKSGCKCGTDTMPPVLLLRWNDTLAVAANSHATDMYYNDYFSHIAPDGSSPIQRAINAGYNGNTILENIAEGYDSLTDVMNAWKASPDHCKAMMDKSVTEMGAARAEGYWAQEFGHR